MAQGKARHPRPRPGVRDSRIQPCIQSPRGEENASYPSGHSTFAFARALVLGDLVPERREALLTFARTVAWSRVLAGVHHPGDIAGGRLLAEAIVAEMRKSPAYQKAREQAKAELAPFLAKPSN